jgi:monoamine oxidase
VTKQPTQTSGTTRRDFLKDSAVAAIGVPLLFSPYVQRRSYSCIIIGAGLAGLAAAHALKNKKPSWDITVLEARERTGGRVSSFRFRHNPELVCEVGAEWIGDSHDRMKALCADFKIPLQDHRFDAWLMQDGVVKRPGQWDFSPTAKAAFEKLKQAYEGYSQKQKQRLDQYDWWSLLDEIGFSEDDLLLRDLQDSTDFGETIRMISAYAAAAEYFESSPANEMDFKMEGGNSRLIEKLVASLGAGAVRTGMIVQRIRQRAGRVTVTANGADFFADALHLYRAGTDPRQDCV